MRSESIAISKYSRFCNPAADSANIRQHLINRSFLVSRIAEFAITYRLIDHKLYVGLGLASPSMIFGRAGFSQKLVRVCAVRKNQNLDFKIFREENFDSLFRCLNTRFVAIIIDYHFAGKPA